MGITEPVATFSACFKDPSWLGTALRQVAFGTLDSSATLIGDYRIQVILRVFYCNCTAALDDGGIVVGTIIKPKFGLQPKSSASRATFFDMEEISSRRSAGHPGLLPDERIHSSVVKTMHACVKETGASNSFLR